MITAKHEKWLSEIQKADARLRAFPDGNGRPNIHKPRAAAMRWAIALSQKQLDKLSDGDFSNLQRELACFRRFELKEPVLPGFVEPAPWPSREDINNTQQWIRGILDNVSSRSDNTVVYKIPEREWHLVWIISDRRWGQFYTEKEIEGTSRVHELFDLVREHVDKILRCKAADCQKIFLRDRSNQEFCSTRCQWRTGQRTYKDIPPERYGKRGRRMTSTPTRLTPTPKEKNSGQPKKSKERAHGTKRRTR
ncbi:MAG: hypothetical protein E8D41_14180 [Nitrospira sp.]|nr:MAG: hypothetical protein E8D41_14180 [Nitrospira sp.]